LPAVVDPHLAGQEHQLPVGALDLVGEADPGTAEVVDPGTAVGAGPETAAEVLVPGIVEAVVPGIAVEVVPGTAEGEVAGPEIAVAVEVVPGIAGVAALGTVGAELGPGTAVAVDTAVG